MGGNGKHRWKISFHRSSSHSSRNSQPPKEFLCPITGSLMSDPVVVTSGQTFERLAVQISTEFKFSPKLEDGTRPDFSTIIPNLAIKTTITNWCDKSRTQYPPAPDYTTVEKLIKEAMAAEKEDPIRTSEKELLNAVADNPPVIFSHAATELGPRINRFNSGSSSEESEHAAGALFSLALDDDNKMAIGVLGALQPLMHALRSDSERTRHDSALALYHLTLVQSNRVKLVKLGVVPTLLSMVMTGTMASRVLLILCNLAMSVEGRTAMLDANAVECMVSLLRGNELDSEATRENCVAALYALSHGSLRFKGLAKEAKAVEVLRVIEETGTERAREKAKRVLQKMRGFEDGDDEDDSGFDSLFESSRLTRTRYRGAGARNNNLVNSTTF
ncbi:hypothetical protein TSUD_136810 [Trifolium subterraneum]|uniref:RING-type E3 ubiquitin transferase n=1 Tax=Trifolium subterraneum TaxID=3900 RepID=A0A2Z6P1Z9_TRISU|nr:hypothetical protein TSUD_136810 [Trifolium subterraneum]